MEPKTGTALSSSSDMKWSVLDSIALIETIFKLGTNWSPVASALSEQKQDITSKQCEARFHELLKENNISTTRLPADLSKRKATLLPLMETLNQARIHEIKSLAAEKRAVYNRILQEIELLERGGYDYLLEPEVESLVNQEEPVIMEEIEEEPIDQVIPNSPVETPSQEEILNAIEDVEMQETNELEIEEEPTSKNAVYEDEESNAKDATAEHEDLASKQTSVEDENPTTDVSQAAETETTTTSEQNAKEKENGEELPSILVNAQTAVQGALNVAKTFLFGTNKAEDGGKEAENEESQVTETSNQEDSSGVSAAPAPPSPIKSVGGRNRSLSPIKIPPSPSVLALSRRSALDEVTDNESGTETEYADGPDKKRFKGDERYKTWRRTALMIWNKIADHRAGNRFLKPVKNDAFLKAIKKPLCLEQVKARIRDGTTKTTAEFHRDVLHVLINAVMFNAEDSELYKMALEMMDYADVEMKSLLIYSQANSSSSLPGSDSPTKE